MKKSVLFLASAASLALASCSNEAVEMNQGEAISFRTAFEMPKGRATEITNSDISSITVTAVNQFGDTYFSNVEFGRQGSNFISARKYYWPGDGSELTFTAYNGDGNSKYMDGTSAYTPASDAAGQIDLIYCKGVKGSNANQSTGVELPFKHALSQIEVRAFNSNADEYNIDVVNVKLGNVDKTATFDINATTPAWSNFTGVTAYTNTDDAADVKRLAALPEDGIAPSMMFAGGNMMVLPQTVPAWDKKLITAADKAGYIALKVRVATKGGAWVYPSKKEGVDYTDVEQGYAWVAVPVSIDWKAGMHYIYTLEFGEGAGYTDPENPTPDPENPDPKPVLGGEIKLTVNVAGWDTPTPAPGTISAK